MSSQGQELIQVAQLQLQAREEQELQLSISNEMVQSLEQVYTIYKCQTEDAFPQACSDPFIITSFMEI